MESIINFQALPQACGIIHEDYSLMQNFNVEIETPVFEIDFKNDNELTVENITGFSKNTLIGAGALIVSLYSIASLLNAFRSTQAATFTAHGRLGEEFLKGLRKEAKTEGIYGTVKVHPDHPEVVTGYLQGDAQTLKKFKEWMIFIGSKKSLMKEIIFRKATPCWFPRKF